MTGQKTLANEASVEAYLATRANPAQRSDCQQLMAILARITGEAPRMWGPSIVGYGRYSYRYESGRTGESCVTGFAVRGKELVVYLVSEDATQQALLAQLGKHKMGKACLYIKQLADIDVAVLERLVANAVAETKRRHPEQPA